MQYELQGLPKLPAYFVWSHGSVSDVYTYESDTVSATNIKKGIMSLFQLQTSNKVVEEVKIYNAVYDCRSVGLWAIESTTLIMIN